MQNPVHGINVVRFEVVGQVHQQPQPRMIDLREHLHGFLNRADVVHIGFQQDHRAVVIGFLRQFRDDRAASLKAFLGVIRPGFRDHIRRPQGPRVADAVFQTVHIRLAVRHIGVNDVGIAQDTTDRQIMRAKRIAHFFAVRRRQIAVAQINVIEMRVQLHGVKAVAADFLSDSSKPYGKYPEKYSVASW
jgi:hypothetical protein